MDHNFFARTNKTEEIVLQYKFYRSPTCCSHNTEHHMQSLNPYNTTTTTLSTILGKSFNTAILGNHLDQRIILVERNSKEIRRFEYGNFRPWFCHVACASTKLSSSTNSTGALRCSHNRDHHMQSLNPYNTTTTTLSTILGTSFNTAIQGNQLDQSIVLVEQNPKRYGPLNVAISGLDFAMWRAPLRVEKSSSSHDIFEPIQHHNHHSVHHPEYINQYNYTIQSIGRKHHRWREALAEIQPSVLTQWYHV